MPGTVLDLLQRIRATSSTNRELGTRFERLMVTYLKSDPQWTEQFDEVWMWADSPLAVGDATDTGIDLVARDVETGGYCAIQCKCYEPDHTLSKADIDSFFTASGRSGVTRRLIISTTEKLGPNVQAALADQQIPVSLIGMAALEASPIDWDKVTAHAAWEHGAALAEDYLHDKKSLRPHQETAVDAVFDGFETHERGKLIMACGTGKTFTSLKIAERLAAERAESGEGDRTSVLFLVPSIALLSQTLREWTAETETAMRSFAVCSDAKVSKRAAGGDFGDQAVYELAFPATTSAEKLIRQFGRVADEPGLTVVFSTYQSLPTVAAAQEAGLGAFDLVLCDEAHRTTGVTLAGAEESNFVRVHDNDYLAAEKRLYMTATPKIFTESTKSDAKSAAALLCSMDDEALFGPEFHRLGFGTAVEAGLLTDYKVLILTVDEGYAAAALQQQLADENMELNLADAAKIIGCWNGLAKRTGSALDEAGGHVGFRPGEPPMRRAVAFAQNIAASKQLTKTFAEVVAGADAANPDRLRCEIHHVDGTMNALKRNAELDWLRADPGEGHARILSNARCLSEGVDVPDLDAVLFLHPRNSVVDVVQSVGRVMRRAEGKQYGYIVLPVAVPAGVSPEGALADNKRFKVVWEVLNALRAHDERFNAMINKIELNKKKPQNLMTGHVGAGDDTLIGDGTGNGTGGSEGELDKARATQEAIAGLMELEQWQDAIYARIVQKVGERTYWEDWASDIASIANRHVTRIKVAIDRPDKRDAFAEFVNELRSNLNPGIGEDDAIDMLSQHLITKPVFDALFADYAFAAHNPVSKAMERMLRELDDQSLESELETLERFYKQVRVRAEGIDNHEGRQKVITELYERFFKTALPKTADKLGIVYTPVPVVDFILRATDQALRKYLGASLTDEGVHVIDPFTGTGTFMVRLLQSGLIRPEDLLRKYTSELHANEIVLLAYYIAAVNVEAAFHDRHDKGGEYLPFEGIVLTDTFQLYEGEAEELFGVLEGNSERAKKQQATDIRVVIGNPPYSVGQGSQNDDNQNLKYEHLDQRIQRTYAAKSTATNKNSLYDSYIRAFRWASDRIKDEGVVCYVSNNGYIDGNTADGLRKTFVDDFDAIYCYNLRGNQRTAGELSRREGGKIFGSGSRTGVAVLLLVKGGSAAAEDGTCRLFYRDIGDYLSQKDKLDIVDGQDLEAVEWQQLSPTEEGDWVTRRDTRFPTFRAIGDKDTQATRPPIFGVHSRGLETTRDAWVFNTSVAKLSSNVQSMINFYNKQVGALSNRGIPSANSSKERIKQVEEFIDRDPQQISWSSSLIAKAAQKKAIQFDPESITTGAYRPFNHQAVYFNGDLNHRVGQQPRMFPDHHHENLGFYVNGFHATSEFTLLAVNEIPCLDLFGKGGYFFSRWTYRETASEGTLFEGVDGGYEQVDNITDAALHDYQQTYADTSITKDDIFYYVYALLHSTDYRTAFEADLKKSLPRIPKVEGFGEFAEAGRRLAELHLGYETVEPYAGIGEEITGSGDDDLAELYRVDRKMRFISKQDKSAIVYNNRVTLTGIPEEAYRYQLGARSAVEWIIDRYYVKTDKASGIVNDPNDWSDDPRYIVDLLKRIVTVSVETMKIVDSLPAMEILPEQ